MNVTQGNIPSDSSEVKVVECDTRLFKFKSLTTSPCFLATPNKYQHAIQQKHTSKTPVCHQQALKEQTHQPTFVFFFFIIAHTVKTCFLYYFHIWVISPKALLCHHHHQMRGCNCEHLLAFSLSQMRRSEHYNAQGLSNPVPLKLLSLNNKITFLNLPQLVLLNCQAQVKTNLICRFIVFMGSFWFQILNKVECRDHGNLW